MSKGQRRISWEGKCEVTAARDTLETPNQETREGHKKSNLSSPHRILIVDDSKDARESLAVLLRELGYLVLTAHDGAIALQRALDFKPHVMLLDIVMPGISGFRVAEMVRADPRLRDTLLITLSGWSLDVDLWLSKNAGCDYHLLKPLDVFVLESLLERGRPTPNFGEV
jgi:CheY-like chemotaxis protein